MKCESDSFNKAKEKENNLSSCKIRFMRNLNNQTSVFEVSTVLFFIHLQLQEDISLSGFLFVLFSFLVACIDCFVFIYQGDSLKNQRAVATDEREVIHCGLVSEVM